MEYTKVGTCIWCKRSKPEVTFRERPHTIPQSLGSRSIGFDICDDCNHYFGKPDNLILPHLSIEVCFKELLNISKLCLNYEKLNEHTHKQFKSVYFEYRHSKSAIVIKKSFRTDRVFLKTFTNQFKRGLYEMFLQEFHKLTLKGLDTNFEELRLYARYNQGDFPVYYMINGGAILVDKDMREPYYNFSESIIKEINDYGFYTLLIWGHLFFLEVIPKGDFCRNAFIEKQKKQWGAGFVNRGIIELKYINEIDFTFRCLFS